MGSGSALFDENHLYRTEQQYVIETVCQDLEREGYSVQPFVIPACAVGAPHRRDRVWFVANRANAGAETVQCRGKDGVHAFGASSDTHGHRNTPRTACEGTEKSRRPDIPQPEEWGNPSERADGLHGLSRFASDPHNKGLQGKRLSTGHDEKKREESGRHAFQYTRDGRGTLPADRWKNFPTQSPVCGRNDGLPFHVDDLTIPFTKWRTESIKAYGNAWVPQVAYEIFRSIQQTEDEMTYD